MTARELASVLLKILGIYWIFTAIVMLPNVLAIRSVTATDGFNSETVFYSQLFTVLFTLALGTTLLAATSGVLRLFFASVGPTGTPLNTFTLQAVALSLLGAWLLVVSLPQLASIGVMLLVLSKAGRELERTEYLRTLWSSASLPLCEAALGSWLFLGARGLARLWHKLRPIRT